MCFGFCTVEYVPSPKLQFHAVGVFVLASVKVIVRGAVPEVRDPQKLTTGIVAFVVLFAVTFM